MVPWKAVGEEELTENQETELDSHSMYSRTPIPRPPLRDSSQTIVPRRSLNLPWITYDSPLSSPVPWKVPFLSKVSEHFRY